MLIGITGKAGSGKDTVGDWLQYNGYTRAAFAAPIKRALAAMGLAEPRSRDLKEYQIAGFDFTWRKAAQTLGTEWGRGLDANIWLKMMEKTIKQSQNLVITDVRFDNEADLIHLYGGKILCLTGREADLGEQDRHESEQGLRPDNIDCTIDNGGTFESLLEKLQVLHTELCANDLRLKPLKPIFDPFSWPVSSTNVKQ